MGEGQGQVDDNSEPIEPTALNVKDQILNILTWNIEGLYKYGVDYEFKYYLRKFGVICFCQTWGKKISDFNDFRPGYKHYGNVRKQSYFMLNSGWVSLFIHGEIIKTGIVKQFYTYFKDCIVIILKGDNFLDGKDIIIYFAYISPERSPIMKN